MPFTLRTMLPAFRTPASRIAFAIVFSVLLHASFLWLPYFHLPHFKAQLPALTVRLESRTESMAVPAERLEPERSAISLDNGAAPASAPQMAKQAKRMEKSATSHQLPKQVQISYVVYQGADASRVGVLHQQLDVEGEQYILRSTQQLAGLSGLLNSAQLTQTSYGKIGSQGLQPEYFEENTVGKKAGGNRRTTFNWNTKQAKKLL